MLLQDNIRINLGNARTWIVPNRLNHSAPLSANKNFMLSVPLKYLGNAGRQSGMDAKMQCASYDSFLLIGQCGLRHV